MSRSGYHQEMSGEASSRTVPTNISDRQWIRLILDRLESLSDRSLQLRAWSGAGPEVWSPCEAADESEDIQIDLLIQRGTVPLSDGTLASIRQLMRFIGNSYISDERMGMAADSPLWIEIRRLAADALDQFVTNIRTTGFGDLTETASAERLADADRRDPT